MEPKRLYDRIAPIYDRRHESPSSAWLRWHQDRILKRLEGKTIDIGCGTGRDLKLLGDDAIGIDPSRSMLEIAKLTGKRVLLGRAENLPFPDASFDNALCLFCVLNMCDFRKAVSEMSRVLRPGGIAVVSVASVWDRGHGFFQKLRLKHPARVKSITIDGNKTRLVLFGRQEFAALFESSGLKMESFVSLFKFQRPLWGNWSPLPFCCRLKLWLDRLPVMKSHGAIYLAVFRKA